MDKEMLEFMKRIEAQLYGIELSQKETYQILKALEHSAEVNKSEHDNMAHDIASIKGGIEALRSDLNAVEMITSKNWNEIAKLKAVK